MTSQEIYMYIYYVWELLLLNIWCRMFTRSVRRLYITRSLNGQTAGILI